MPISIFIVAVMALLLAGCQMTPTEQGSSAVAPKPQGGGEDNAGVRTLSSGTGAPLAGYYVAPAEHAGPSQPL